MTDSSETTIATAATVRAQPMLKGYLRSDGRKGIRNVVAVAYLVECAHHVAREIVTRCCEPAVHLIGFPGCYANSYAEKMLEQLTTHPNVGAVLFVSLGCESMNKHYLVDVARASGRPVDVLTIQENGTRNAIQSGVDWVCDARKQLAAQQRVPMALSELVIGTICGGSDGTGDNAEIGELIAGGAHVILSTTGRGSVMGSAISPVVKVCANPASCRNLPDDMNVDAGRILDGRGTLEELGREAFDQTVAVAQGAASKSETLGQQEFILSYKTLEPVGPACLPSSAAPRHRVVGIATIARPMLAARNDAT